MLEFRNDKLYIDGEYFDENILVKVNSKNFFYLVSDSIEVSKNLLQFSFNDFQNISTVKLQTKLDWLKSIHSITIYKIKENFFTAFNYDVKILVKEVENLLDYYTQLFRFVEIFRGKNSAFQISGLKIKHNEDLDFQRLSKGFSIVFEVKKPAEKMTKLIDDNLKLLKKWHLEITENSQEVIDNSLKTFFKFPDEIKINCEQYLIYFAQFLRDLGIDANSNLKQEAGKVLFSVTPTDDVEALDKIREALAIYLSLPSNPIPNSTGDRTVDMVLSGARANVKHLESQLELAIAKLQFKEATLELKDATIEQNQFALRQKDETIKHLQEIVARGNIFEESLERVEINGEVVDESSLYRFSREDDIEVEAKPILEEKSKEARIGLVKFHEVTKLKDYGVSLDLPKAIRGLIDYFKRDKNSR